LVQEFDKWVSPKIGLGL